MQATVRRLRPMNLSDVLDETFSLYRQNFALFAGIVAVLAVPHAIISTIIAVSHPSTSSFLSTQNGTSTFNGGDAVTYGALNLANWLLSLIFSTLITGALAIAISRRYLGRDTSIAGAYRAIGVGTFFLLMVVSILQGLAIVAGFILVIVPGIILLVRWSFVAQALVLERTGFGGSFGRSWWLVSGSFWRVFGYIIVIYLISTFASGALSGITIAVISLLGGNLALSTAIAALVAIVVQPFQLGALTLLYYDLRIRKEGFDLEHMAQTLESDW